MPEMHLSDDFADNLFDQTFTVWVNPELEKRRHQGLIAETFVVWAAQVIFQPDGPEIVRLNDEVDGVFRVRPGAIPEGTLLSPANFHEFIPSLEAFHLSLSDSPNAGHITLIRHQQGFYIAFDLLYNAERIAEHILAARDFLEIAKSALSGGRTRPFVANIFHAVELMAKALLLRHPDPKLLSLKSHTYLQRRYNLESHRGNTDAKFAALLNELGNARNPARYPVGQFVIEPTKAEEWLQRAEEMYAMLRASAPIRSRIKIAERDA